jgi:hypothetical protein
LLSGFVLWMTKPTRYIADTAFMLKLSLVIIGIALTLYFYAMMKRGAASWDAEGAVPSRGIKFAAATLLVWRSRCGSADRTPGISLYRLNDVFARGRRGPAGRRFPRAKRGLRLCRWARRRVGPGGTTGVCRKICEKAFRAHDPEKSQILGMRNSKT